MTIVQNTKKIIRSYYLLLAFALVSQAVITCVKLGQTISYNHRLQAITVEKQQLQREYELKQVELSAANSLLANKIELDQGYVPISSPIVISAQETLALR